MKTISIHSKKGMQYINAYERSKATELTHIYKKCSYNKEQAYAECRTHAERNGAENMKIISHNCNFFSCAAKSKEGLIVYTPCQNYIVK